MPKQKAVTKAIELAQRRHKVACLYLSGKNQTEIGEIVGIHQGTVSSDLMALREQWKEDSNRDYGEKIDQEIAKINHMERVALEAWERSCQAAEICIKRVEKAPKFLRHPDDQKPKRPNGKKETKGVGNPPPMVPVKIYRSFESRGQTGDPRFLEIVQWCITTRLKLLAAFPKEGQGQEGGQSVQVPWETLWMRKDESDPVEEQIHTMETARQNGEQPKASEEIIDGLPIGLKEMPKVVQALPAPNKNGESNNGEHT